MASRNIVVIGASAGGIEALLAVARSLPADLPAAVFVVVHVPSHADSRLPEILARAGPLPAAHARQGEPIVPGRIYVAPPDRHLLVRPGRVELTRGPRENHSRPAVDPLFRSAARAYGPAVVGVVLSGALHDGASGLMAVRARGGVAVVQDPVDAAFSSMPSAALRLSGGASVLPAARIGPELDRLTRETAPAEVGHAAEGGTVVVDAEERIEQVIRRDFAAQAADGRADEPTPYSCPDCGGVLWQDGAGAALRFRCHVGHAYAPEVLLGQKSEELEAALWACVRLLREKATLTRQALTRAGGAAGDAGRSRIEEQAELNERYAQVIRDLLEAMPNSGDQAVVVVGALDGGAASGTGTS